MFAVSFSSVESTVTICVVFGKRARTQRRARPTVADTVRAAARGTVPGGVWLALAVTAVWKAFAS